MEGLFTITTTEDSSGLSNFIVTSDSVNNPFNFSASFSDYLQEHQQIPYFTATSSTATQSVFNLETDTVASYDIGDQDHLLSNDK
ncbi:MAG: hypothetical protein CM15mP117_03600 [Alphaproteobacteria bacterium]|nr:MAG: hypothetical protein CM15mP117_03600 [Alphaproteobacteria bacterium]